MRQLTFPLHTSPKSGLQGGFENFFRSSSNEMALGALKREWPGHKLIMFGPAGVGKSYLAKIWAKERGGEIISAQALDADFITRRKSNYIVVEDIAPGLGAQFEEALCHLHNLVAAPPAGGLLMVARLHPCEWEITLADLKSRIDSAEHVRFAPPDDILLKAVLIKASAERQLTLSAGVINYIVKRMERNLSQVSDIVHRLDSAALERGQAITLKLVRDVLGFGAAGE